MGALLNRASFNLSSTSGGSSGLFVYTFYSTVTEVTDDITNTSTLTAKLTYKADTTGKLFNGSGFTATLQYSLDDTNWTKIASASRDTYTGTSEVTLVSGTSVTIRHNDDGKKAIYYRVVVTNNGNSYAPRSGDHKWTINLTDIPRGHQFTLNKTMLTAGEIATLSIEKNVASYTSSVVWQRGDQSGVLLNKSDATTLEIPYATITDGMATGVSATVILLCTTFNGDTEVSTVRLDIVVSSGHIALSLYDDGVGNVGATIGERATDPGFWVKGIAVDFTQATEVRGIYEEIKDTNIYGRKWANGFLEYFIDKYVPAGGYTSWQGHYYRDYDVNITFPTAFSSVQGAVAGYSNATCYSTQTRELSNTKTPIVRLMAFTNQSSLTGDIHMYIWGYWK